MKKEIIPRTEAEEYKIRPELLYLQGYINAHCGMFLEDKEDFIPRLQRLIRNRISVDIPYSEIILDLYESLRRPYVLNGSVDKIGMILNHSTNHEFMPFVRLTNSRLNPNEYSRKWAINILVDITNGNEHALGGYGKRWVRGSRYRLKQLGKM